MEKTQSSELLNEGLSFLEPITGFLPYYPAAQSAIILTLAIIVAKLMTIVVTQFFGRLTKKTRTKWDDIMIDALGKPIFWSLILAGILLALLPLNLKPSVGSIAESFVLTFLILLWSGFIFKVVRLVLRGIAASDKQQALVSNQTLPLFENLALILIIVLTVYFIFSSWNIDMTAWIASAGIAGIAIGFAAKDTLANLFSGVFILADTPYKIGDYVVLDSGERGKVTHIGIRSTRLLTRGDVEITIPNAIMGNSSIINESGGPYVKYRIRVQVGVAYGSDIDKVKDVLMDIANNSKMVCTDPEPRVRFRSFGASSLDIDLLCWVDNPELRGLALDELNTSIYKRFNSEGIEIPYSKHDVYIKEMPQGGDK